LFGWPNSFFTAGWLALGLQSSGYLAETFRAGIEGVARGHREAGYSVGMSPLLVFRRIVMPQTVLTVSPSIVNQFTVIVKSSTLVSVITVQDLMFQAMKLVNVWYEPIEILTVTAGLYIVLVFLVSTAGKMLADLLRRRYGLAAA
jgi:polar amino acid transport system permease protein